jgi:hypothetical protein
VEDAVGVAGAAVVPGVFVVRPQVDAAGDEMVVCVADVAVMVVERLVDR